VTGSCPNTQPSGCLRLTRCGMARGTGPMPASIGVAPRAKRQPACPYVRFRLDRRGNAAKIGGFRKAWQSRCVKPALGWSLSDPVTGKTVYANGSALRAKTAGTNHGASLIDTRSFPRMSYGRAGVKLGALLENEDKPGAMCSECSRSICQFVDLFIT
jgi:hypothetical protein